MFLDWTKKAKQTWTMKRDRATVKTRYESCFKDVLNQIRTEKMMFEVNDNGETKKFAQEEDSKFIFPQEFKTLLTLNGKFEFLGWWKGNCNSWHLDQPLEKVQDEDETQRAQTICVAN
jgi:hypothetical protein